MFVRMTAVAYMLHLHVSGQNSSPVKCKELWYIIVHYSFKECVPKAINTAYPEQSKQPWYSFFIASVVKKVLIHNFTSSTSKKEERERQKCPLMSFFNKINTYLFIIYLFSHLADAFIQSDYFFLKKTSI